MRKLSTTPDFVPGISTTRKCFWFGGLLAIVLGVCLEYTAFLLQAFRIAFPQ